MASHYIDELVKNRQEEREEELKHGYTIDIYDGETGQKIGTEYRPGTEQAEKVQQEAFWEDPDMIWVAALVVSLLILALSLIKLSRQLKRK